MKGTLRAVDWGTFFISCSTALLTFVLHQQFHICIISEAVAILMSENII